MKGWRCPDAFMIAPSTLQRVRRAEYSNTERQDDKHVCGFKLQGREGKVVNKIGTTVSNWKSSQGQALSLMSLSAERVPKELQ
jgi:hypothetical protein